VINGSISKHVSTQLAIDICHFLPHNGHEKS